MRQRIYNCMYCCTYVVNLMARFQMSTSAQFSGQTLTIGQCYYSIPRYSTLLQYNDFDYAAIEKCFVRPTKKKS